MINKQIAITLATIAAVGATTFGVKHVFAADTQPSDPMSSLIQKLVQKFNLNEADVKAVFEADRTERETQRQTDYQQRLTDAVTKGEITEAQKQLILAKQAELEAARQNQQPVNFKNLTDAEKEAQKTKMDAERTALEEWAKTNGIDVKYLMMGGRGSGGDHNGPPPEN